MAETSSNPQEPSRAEGTDQPDPRNGTSTNDLIIRAFQDIDTNEALSRAFKGMDTNEVLSRTFKGVDSNEVIGRAFKGVDTNEVLSRAFKGIESEQVLSRAFKGIDTNEVIGRAFKGVNTQEVIGRAFKGVESNEVIGRAFKGVDTNEVLSRAFRGIESEQVLSRVFKGIDTNEVLSRAFKGVDTSRVMRSLDAGQVSKQIDTNRLFDGMVEQIIENLDASDILPASEVGISTSSNSLSGDVESLDDDAADAVLGEDEAADKVVFDHFLSLFVAAYFGLWLLEQQLAHPELAALVDKVRTAVEASMFIYYVVRSQLRGQ